MRSDLARAAPDMMPSKQLVNYKIKKGVRLRKLYIIKMTSQRRETGTSHLIKEL